MNWTIHQTITIGQLRVDGVTNSSVLQIGSAGSIQSLSQLGNTGGFTGPAPQINELSEANSALSLVPLPNPR
ncbi:spore germination protein GerPB [Cohnella abietis]|uniref:Putative spore germination protein GerPB n=1 Tax=Cohnella abietis TaxID=2507935 RepID=A0A3T1D4K1_9BACL|nr:spore germination protein GerPB [Cohnella abietis]BBI33043.1 putative spore germination protein GerPB [Cohnella abietis]